MTDTAVPVVMFRDPRPPHGAYLTIEPADLRYGFKVRRQGTAIFEVARSIATTNLDKMLPPEPAMITVERPDGMLPWVGFVSGYDAGMASPFVTFSCGDHAWRLAQPHGARSKKSETYRAASGVVIRSVFQDMEDRSEPAPLLKYDAVPLGPPANYEVRSDYGLDVLEALARQTNYEWGFAYTIARSSVETHLTWQARQGTDRRDEEIWSEQKHFTAATYSLKYANGIRSAVVVGGAGPFGPRPAAVVNSRGAASDLRSADVVLQKTPVSPYGLGGTRQGFTQQVVDVAVLKTQAQQLHEAPEFAVEQIGMTLIEDQIDMTRLNVGDIRTIRLQTTALGVAIERVVRIIGLQFSPKGHEIQAETQVIA